MLTEHRVFPNDEGSHPLVSSCNGRRKFYYSFWLLSEPKDQSEQAALAAFRAALQRVPQHRIKLAPGDILVDGGNSYYRDDVDRAKKLAAEVSGPCVLSIIEGGNHVVNNLWYRYRDQTADWLATQLGVAKR